MVTESSTSESATIIRLVRWTGGYDGPDPEINAHIACQWEYEMVQGDPHTAEELLLSIDQIALGGEFGLGNFAFVDFGYNRHFKLGAEVNLEAIAGIKRDGAHALGLSRPV